MEDFEKVVDFKNLYKAYRRVKRGKGNKYSATKFCSMAIDGIIRLKKQLETKQYKISKYYDFKVYEPKEREIKASAFKDKIVQHSLCDNVLHPTLEKVFIRNNFAGQKGKGTLFGLKTLRKDMLTFGNFYNGAGYILKADISKFFYNIDHKQLKHILDYYFSDKDIRWLCHLIIDSTNGKGLPLGNQTSQIFALLYLDGLDKFITTELGITFYGRYMDDLYMFHSSKEHLKWCLDCIKEYVKSLGLSLNGKTQIISFHKGIKFLGFHTTYIKGKIISKISNNKKRNAKRKYRKMFNLVKNGKFKLFCFFRTR